MPFKFFPSSTNDILVPNVFAYNFVNAAMRGKFNELKEQYAVYSGRLQPNDINKALFLACKSNHIACVAFLLNTCKADSNFKYGNEGATPLIYAAELGSIELLELLLANGAQIDLATNNGSTALMHAIHCRHFDMAEYLLLKKSNVLAVSSTGATAISAAASVGNLFLIQSMVKLGAGDLLDAPLENGATPFMLAVQEGHIDVIKYLKEQNVDIHRKDKEHNLNPLTQAAFENKIEVLKLLIEWGAKINDIGGGNPTLTALTGASSFGHLAAVKLLVEAGALINPDTDTRPLHEACQYGHKDVVEYLLTYFYDNKHEFIDEYNNKGGTPLHLALDYNHQDIAKILINHGADIFRIETLNRVNALHKAANFGYVDIIKLLLNRGMDINSTASDSNSTALYRAVCNNRSEAALYLIEQGADVNIRATPTANEPSVSPIEAAVVLNNLRVVVAIAMRSDKDIKNAYKIAIEEKYHAIEFYLSALIKNYALSKSTYQLASYFFKKLITTSEKDFNQNDKRSIIDLMMPVLSKYSAHTLPFEIAVAFEVLEAVTDVDFAEMGKLLCAYKTLDGKIPSVDLALRRASSKGCVHTIQTLISTYAANPNATSSNGFTPLDWAFQHDHAAAVKELLPHTDQSSALVSLLKKLSDYSGVIPDKNKSLEMCLELDDTEAAAWLVDSFGLVGAPRP